jgi:hypothetical protein
MASDKNVLRRKGSRAKRWVSKEKNLTPADLEFLRSLAHKETNDLKHQKRADKIIDKLLEEM